MNDWIIMRLIEKGARRWTKGEHDRLYIDSDILGLSVERYNSGNISYAEFQGEKISNSRAAELSAVTIWIDLHTGDVHAKGGKISSMNTMKAAAEELIEAVEAEIAAESEAEQATVTISDVIGAVCRCCTSEDHINADGDYVGSLGASYRLVPVLSDQLAIVNKFRPDGSLQRSFLLWKYANGWSEIWQSRRNHSMIDEFRDGSVYEDLDSCSHGTFGTIVRKIIEKSGIL